MTSDQARDGEPPERYGLTWAGKRAAIQAAGAPARGSLAPAPGESVDFDRTGNLFVEGDNLEALKLLRPALAGRVRMIYVDPPYNTGGDFVYRDDFADRRDAYLRRTGQVDGAGRPLTDNPETAGRRHSAWLSMICPLLRLARDLLRPDGLIFVSIDDHEVSNLRLLLDEVFGEEHFLAQLIRQTIAGGTGPSRRLRPAHDYVVVHARDARLSRVGAGSIAAEPLDLADERGPYRRGRELNKWGAGSRRQDSPTMWFPIPGPNGEDVYPIRNDGSEGRWRWGQRRLLAAVAAGDVVFEPRADGTYVVYEKVRSTAPRRQALSTLSALDAGPNAAGTATLKALFDGRSPLDYPKPVGLIRRLLEIGCPSDSGEPDVVLDFFAGSGTTAQAVLEQNRADGGRRRFVVVQSAEPTGDPDYPTIAEIGKARIRRVCAALRSAAPSPGQAGEPPEDLGFRVLKLVDHSPMRSCIE